MKTTLSKVMMETLSLQEKIWGLVFLISLSGIVLLFYYEIFLLLYYKVKWYTKMKKLNSALSESIGNKNQELDKLIEKMPEEKVDREKLEEIITSLVNDINEVTDYIEKELEKIDSEKERVKKKLFLLRPLV